jgi:hypothetical protein
MKYTIDEDANPYTGLFYYIDHAGWYIFGMLILMLNAFGLGLLLGLIAFLF